MLYFNRLTGRYVLPKQESAGVPMVSAQQSQAKVLISGAGIAGLTCAYWLERAGWQVRLVEQAKSLRYEGYGIEFGGSGWDVARRMNIIPELQRRKMTAPYFLFKDAQGATTARLPMGKFFAAISESMVQIMRADLQDVLYRALAGRAEIVYGRTIQQVDQEPDRVRVQLSDGSQDQYDLLIGADGLHSGVRSLVFGPEQQFAHYLGYYFATFPVPDLVSFEQSAVMYLDVNRQMMVYPRPDLSYLALCVWRAQDQGFVPQAQRKAMLQQAYADAGWLVPDLIADLDAQSPIYLDSLTQIRMPSWSKGRVVLVGDAAHCLTLISGMGSSVAMGGAYILAEELAKDADVTAACAAYEQRARPFVERMQVSTQQIARTFVPDSIWRKHLGEFVLRLMMRPSLARLIMFRLARDSMLRVTLHTG